MDTVRTRFAPSPTGYMHLGNVWVACLNFLYTREHRGRIVLRIEDIDRARSKKEFAAGIMEDLEWLGLTWDEGPDTENSYGSAIQSERTAIYEEVIHNFSENDLVYPCFCTRARLHSIASAPHRGEAMPVYDGHCRYLTAEEREKETKKPSWRLKVLQEETVSYHDILRGDFSEKIIPEADDFVIRRADGMMAYQLAVSIDDGAMGITHVIRGDDLLSSTPYQVYLLQKLGYKVPQYAHLPLLVDKEGVRLSKRQHGITIRSLKENGMTAGDILGLLMYWAGALKKPEPVKAERLGKDILWEDCSNLRADTICIASASAECRVHSTESRKK